MIKMQFKEHIFGKVHSNLLHMNLRKDKLAPEIVALMLYGFINIIGLNIVSRMMQHFALYASCSKKGERTAHLLLEDGEIGIGMMH
jgi:hypothetical protein